MTFIVAEYYLPLYFQSVKQASPLRSGVLILPITLSEAAMGILTAFLIYRTGRYREVIWLGMFLLTLGTGLYIHFDRTSSVAEIVGFELIGGIGAGFLFEPPLIAIQATVSQADTATATASFGFIRNIAMAMSIVIGGVIFQNGMNHRIPYLEAAGLNSTFTKAFSHGEAAASVELIKEIADAGQRIAVEDAFAWSLRNMWIAYTVIMVVGLVASAFIKHNVLSTVHTETQTGIEKMTRREGA